MNEIRFNFFSAANRPTTLWAIMAASYLIVFFAFRNELAMLGKNSLLLFEVANIVVAAIITGRGFFSYFKFQKSILIASAAGLIGGGLIFMGSVFLKLAIPFDIENKKTLFFLLAASPVLEELIYRFFLWKPAERLTNSPVTAWVFTSLIFSVSHLYAIRFTPTEVHSFLWYQAIYTLFAGAGFGYYVYKNNSLLSAVSAHFFFNLGFFLAAILIR